MIKKGLHISYKFLVYTLGFCLMALPLLFVYTVHSAPIDPFGAPPPDSGSAITNPNNTTQAPGPSGNTTQGPGPGGNTTQGPGPGGNTTQGPGPGGNTTQGPGPGGNTTQGPGIDNWLKYDSLCELLAAFLNIVTELGALVGVLFIIWSGFLFLKAQGNPDGIKKAKSTFFWTVVGIAILLSASALLKILFNTISTITTSTGEQASIC